MIDDTAGRDPPIINNLPENRFEIVFPEGTAVLTYHYARDGTLVLRHTEVPVALRERGIGGRLVSAALEYARTNGRLVNPACPFAAAYIDRNPHLQSLVRR